MAKIDSKVLFITTSPRTPAKMIPEIALLDEHFHGRIWNHDTQTEFMKLLKEENFFQGSGENDPAFSARDRITRAPKALGFVSLNPDIRLTPAGIALTTSRRKEEIFLRQLLKFQLPSPYHVPSKKAAKFWIKPYLELFRLIRHFGTLKFDELVMFGLQLVDYREFDSVVKKIELFREAKVKNIGNYKAFKAKYFEKELRSIYADEISLGDTKTRESIDKSIGNFVNTKARNMRDYADACIRYLRATGLVAISHVGKSLSIIPERIKEVDYFLMTIDRAPCYINQEKDYTLYLTNPALPVLYTDNRSTIISTLHAEFPSVSVSEIASTEELKDMLDDARQARKEEIISKQVKELKDYKMYDDIQTVFKQIAENSLYDPSLMLEWNTWRAMTMLDGGNIKANLKFDDFGKPMSTAQGNMSDIICDYGSFDLCVEVTMQGGQRQYEMEGEPVSRHLAKIKKANGRPAYCLFIAPTINDSCIAHFYALHKMDIAYYGGKSIIVPLPLNLFQKMVEDSYKAAYTPNPSQVEAFFKHSVELSEKCNNETDWYAGIKEAAINWLSI